MFLDCSELRRTVVNDEFGEVGHDKGFEFYSVYNLCYSTLYFF